jgi:hypothetical protein
VLGLFGIDIALAVGPERQLLDLGDFLPTDIVRILLCHHLEGKSLANGILEVCSRLGILPCVLRVSVGSLLMQQLC